MRRGGHTTTAAVVCSQWLRQHCDQVKLIDASWSLNKKTGVSHVTKLPGSKYFDIDEIADKSSGLPHMLPSASVFEAKMDELGISNKDKVVVFDESDGQFVASARVWWTFRAFGHDEVHVLAGGLKGWPKDLPVPQQEKVSGGNRFVARKNASLVWSKQEVLNNLERKDKFQIVDARSRERFYCQVLASTSSKTVWKSMQLAQTQFRFFGVLPKLPKVELTMRTPYRTFFENFNGFTRIYVHT